MTIKGISDSINYPRKCRWLLNRNYLFSHQTKYDSALLTSNRRSCSQKIWTTQQGLLNSVIIPKRYSCRRAVAFYGPNNDVPCLKYCWRWVIVSLDLHFGDNCFLGGEIWPRREDSFVWLRIRRRTAIVFLVSLIIDSDDLIQ